jgi:hypothetical protein
LFSPIKKPARGGHKKTTGASDGLEMENPPSGGFGSEHSSLYTDTSISASRELQADFVLVRPSFPLPVPI